LRGVKNKKSGEGIEMRNLKYPPDSERRETFETLIPLKLVLKRVLDFLPFTGISSIGVRENF
jgi:hypothetical protein